MSFSLLKKNKLKLTAFSLAALHFNLHAATSLMASGHAGIVGQYSANTPPQDSTYNAVRVPIGLILQASPNDNLNIYLGLDYAHNNYPQTPVLLGQTSSTSQPNGNQNGQYTPMPFANTVNGTTAYGEKTDQAFLTQAYFAYQTSFGLLKAGRMPHHWGLGIWNNNQWSPTGGRISTTDAVAMTTDLNLFDITFYYERIGQSVGGTSSDGNAIAYTAEARLKADTSDVPSTGISREIGIAFSNFSHTQTDTVLNILDIYGKFYISNFYAGTEILYPSGHSQNPNYQSLGGAPVCSETVPGSIQTTKTCQSQDFSALAALLKLKYQLTGDDNSSIAATESSQKLMGTAERLASNVFGMWIGYASGGSSQFKTKEQIGINSNKISAIAMHPNIQPSFLMFNNTMPPVNGMPVGSVTNTTFVRLDYTYENPSFGSISPILVWGKLNTTNEDYNSNNSTCNSSPVVTANSSVNHVCLGSTSNLGAEIDASYHYTTLDRVNFGLDLGYWFVGGAWQIYAKNTPNNSYGIRFSTGYEF